MHQGTRTFRVTKLLDLNNAPIKFQRVHKPILQLLPIPLNWSFKTHVDPVKTQSLVSGHICQLVCYTGLANQYDWF